MPKITKTTTVSLNVVLVIIAAAIAWGVLTQKVWTIEGDVGEIKAQVISLDEKLNRVLNPSIVIR